MKTAFLYSNTGKTIVNKRHKKCFVGAHTIAMLAFVACAPFLSADPVWVGEDGNWNDPNNWSDATVPTGGTVHIENGGTVTLEDVVYLSRLEIGNSGIGNLILDGGKLSASDNWSAHTVIIGGTGTGSLQILNDGEFTSEQDIRIGYSGGRGEVTIESGFMKSGWQIWLGMNGGTGIVTLNGGLMESGTSSTPGDFFIGHSGTGYLNINEDGVAHCLAYNKLGYTNGYTGTVAIADSGQMISDNELYVGVYGKGVMEVGDSGVVDTFRTTYLGFYSGGEGVVNLSGQSQMTSSGDLIVGHYGTGTLVIGGSSTLETTATNKTYDGNVTKGTYIGNATGSVGSVTVTGSGSMINKKELSVGAGGRGTLLIEESGTVRTSGGSYIGRNSGGTGTVTVKDSGSMINETFFYVAYSGTAILNIEEGGTVQSTDATYGVYLGGAASGNGTVNVNGGDMYTQKHFYVGFNGQGFLNVNEGFVQTQGATVLGVKDTASGTVNLRGGILETSWVTKGTGAASLTFDGGTLRAIAGAEAAFIDDIGPVTVTTNGGTIDANGQNITVSSSFSGGATGVLTKKGTGTLTLDKASTLGGFVLENDRLTLADTGGLTIAGTMSLYSNSTLRLEGSAFVTAGILDLRSAANIELNPNASLIHTTEILLGATRADSSKVNVTLLDFAGLAVGESMQIMEIESVSSAYGTGFDADDYFELTNDSGYLFEWKESGLYLTAVPEPSTYAMGIAGMLGALALVRLRSRAKR